MKIMRIVIAVIAVLFAMHLYGNVQYSMGIKDGFNGHSTLITELREDNKNSDSEES